MANSTAAAGRGFWSRSSATSRSPAIPNPSNCSSEQDKPTMQPARLLRIWGTVCAAMLLATSCAGGESGRGISVEDAMARPSPIEGGTGGAFMTIVNDAPDPDHLVSASSPAAVVELHGTVDDNGVMRMIPHPRLGHPGARNSRAKTGREAPNAHRSRQPPAGQTVPSRSPSGMQVRLPSPFDQVPLVPKVREPAIRPDSANARLGQWHRHK
jgi:hypothetical protein